MSLSYAIGIDVGGSSVKYGLTNSSGSIIYSSHILISAHHQQDDILELMCQAVARCAEKVDRAAILGIGIGFPGIVDEGVIMGGPDNLPGFENVNVAKLIEAKTGLATLVNNDANMMALGEVKFGAAKGAMDAVFLTVGTGIGGGLVINGQLYGGYKNRGTEMGHIIIEKDGQLCPCGGKGCLESYASTNALIAYYKSLFARPERNVNGKTVIDNYLHKQPEALAAMERHFDYLAVGVASLVNVFSPQKVVIGGGISESGSFYIAEIEKRVKETAIPNALVNTTLVAASNGNSAGILGCAASVFSKYNIIG